MTKFRKGDTVALTATVRHDYRPDDDAFVFVDVASHHTALMLKADTMTLIAPRIDVGERVRWTNGNEATVLASDSDKLWVKADDGTYLVWPAKEVTIIPPVEPDVDAGPYVLPLAGSLEDEIYETPPPAPLDGKVGSEETI
jgi:hypothetical protein